MVFYKCFLEEKAAAEKRHQSLVDEVRQKVLQLENNQKQLIKQNKWLTSTVLNQQNELNDLKQQQLSGNLIINGIPECEASPTHTSHLVKSIVVGLGVNCTEEDIIEARRLGRQSSDTENPSKRSILVKFSGIDLKRKIIVAKRKIPQLNCAGLTYNGKNIGTERDVIYINEDLTPLNANLYRQARNLRKNGQLKFVWIGRGGSVLVREKEGLPYQRIRDEGQLKKFSQAIVDVEMSDPAADAGDDTDNPARPIMDNGESFAGRRLRERKKIV